MSCVRFRNREGFSYALYRTTGMTKRFEDLLIIERGKVIIVSPGGMLSPLLGEGLESIYLMGIVATEDGTVYVCDFGSIYKITIDEGRHAHMTVLAGPGVVSPGRLYHHGAMGMCMDNYGNILATDSHNQRIVKVTPAGEVSTFMGGAEDGVHNVQFMDPHSICISGDVVYVRDGEHSIVSINNGESRTIHETSALYRITSCSGQLFALAVSNAIYRGSPLRPFQGNSVVGFRDFLAKKPFIFEILGSGDTLYVLENTQLWTFNLKPIWSTKIHHVSSPEFKGQVKALMILWTRSVGTLKDVPLEIMFLMFSKLYLVHGCE